MSKQPRGRVRVGGGNTVGARTADIFDEVEKFQARYAKHKASTNKSEESEAYTASRLSAIQAIQMITNWLYWQTPSADSSPPATQNSQPGSRKHHGRSFKKLKAAAEARKQATATSGRKELSSDMNEYWVPSALVLLEASSPDSGSKPESKPKVDHSPTETTKRPRNDEFSRPKEDLGNPIRWGVPMGTAFVAAAVVRLQLGEPVGGLKEHVGGSMLLAIVNSSWLQVILAGVTWYLIGMSVVELVEVLRRK